MFLLLTLLLASPSPANEAEICEGYPALQASLHCAPGGYLDATAQPLCQDFVRVDEQFSPAGRVAMAKIRRCLVAALENQRDTLTCDNVEERAFASHVGCYVAAGFCKLPTSDWFTTFSHLGSMLLDTKAWDQFFKLRAACGRFPRSLPRP